jgi:hypothetical protein
MRWRSRAAVFQQYDSFNEGAAWGPAAMTTGITFGPGTRPNFIGGLLRVPSTAGLSKAEPSGCGYDLTLAPKLFGGESEPSLERAVKRGWL